MNILEMLQNAARGTYNGMSQSGEEMAKGIADAAMLPQKAWTGEMQFNPQAGSVRDMPDENIGQVLNFAGNMGGGGITTGAAPAGSLGMFVGQKAKTFPHGEMLSQGMGEALGRTPQEIYAATGAGAGSKTTTGIFRGVDGLPRVEIPDNAATSNFSSVRNGKMTPLGAILDHPELYKAYPELDRLNVTTSPRQSYYSLGQGTTEAANNGPHISVAREGKSSEDMHSTLLHEIQHWVQEKEGFGQGYNPNGPDILNAQVIKDLQTRTENARRERLYAQNRQEMGGPDIPGASNADIKKWTDAEKRARYETEVTKYDAYARAAGEVEARAVQARRGMSLADRQLEYPFDWMGRDMSKDQTRLSYPVETQWIPGKTRPFPAREYR